jgi:aminopeptidase-like protein
MDDSVAGDQGQALHDFCRELFPICRSITGDGVRETLGHIARRIPIEVHEVPSGTRVFDWEVPAEWNIREAYIERLNGERVIDFADSNLHVVSYSTAVDEVVPRDVLDAHLHSLEDFPDRIPYRTSYYSPTWGFCLSHRQRQALQDEAYRVRIDSSHTRGSLTYGELFLPGRESRELLISTHTCHPSLANDNLSGLSVATRLAELLLEDARANGPARYGVRFIFIPGTIGSITWLAQNQSALGAIVSALVISGVGDGGRATFKVSRAGNGIIDRAFGRATVAHGGGVRPYLPYGYDERQFCSPGIDIPTGCLMRTPYGEYDAYHSSADDLQLVTPAGLHDTLRICVEALHEIQHSPRYINLQPNCEPQLGRRGLYDTLGGNNEAKNLQLALLWMLSYSDGTHTLADIAGLSGIENAVLERAAELLANADLLAERP